MDSCFAFPIGLWPGMGVELPEEFWYSQANACFSLTIMPLTSISHVIFTKLIHMHQTPQNITVLTTENSYLNEIIPFLSALIYIK